MSKAAARASRQRALSIVEQTCPRARTLPVTAPEISHVAVNSPTGEALAFFQLSNVVYNSWWLSIRWPDVDVNTRLFIGPLAAPNFVVSTVFHRFSGDRDQIGGYYVLSPKRFSMRF